MVELITPPKPIQPQAAAPVEHPQPKPKPIARVVPRPVEPPKAVAQPPTVITAPAEAPAVVAAPPLAVASSGPPGPAVGSPPPGAAAPSGSGEVATTPPIFNADYLENPSPAYPPVSRRMREQGRVMLRVLVNTHGTADEVQVRSTSGISRLDEAAVETVKRWKFVPAKRGSDAVSAWVLIPISFTLEG
jgi:protein TonB